MAHEFRLSDRYIVVDISPLRFIGNCHCAINCGYPGRESGPCRPSEITTVGIVKYAVQNVFGY